MNHSRSAIRQRLLAARHAAGIFCLALALHCGEAVASAAEARSGRELFNYYCYQCHGYAGDAATLAATYLDPRPRDFTASDPGKLTIERMRDAVSRGIEGTAMVSFSRVLSAAEIDAVVHFIRDAFMQPVRLEQRYHTAENGWPDHQRYADAFPFATGRIALDRPWRELDATQRRGKRLFLRACVSCHDRARVDEHALEWSPHAVSYPRSGKYDPDAPIDARSGASTFARHERMPELDQLDVEQQLGQQLFQANCAFCHGRDGSGRNWIGSFMDPPARDLGALVTSGAASATRMAEVIAEGLPGSSMPAWRDVLTEQEIAAIVAYVRRALALPVNRANSGTSSTESGTDRAVPTWQRR